MPTYHIQSEDIQESSSWLKQNMQTLLDGMTQAKSKIDTLIQGGYNTPQAQAKFGPYFEEYKSSVDETLRGMEASASTSSRSARPSRTPTTRRHPALAAE